MDKISIIVPVYNVEKYLNRCIESILAQTYKNFDLILVNDGSPDNCGKICDKYALKDSRIIVIHKENGGLSDARNAGIDWAFNNSDSEWITFIDSDDWVHPQFLEILSIAILQSNTLTCTVNYMSVSDYDFNNYKTYDLNDDFINGIQICETEKFWINNINAAVIACGKLFNKSLFLDTRFPVGKLHEDEFTTYKLFFKCDKVSYINLSLYYYYTNPRSITNNQWSPKRLDGLEALREKMDFFKKNKYDQLYVWQLNNYIINIYLQLAQLDRQEDNKYRKKFVKKLRLLLQCQLLLNRNLHTIKFENKPLIYEIAFPRGMQLYWVLKSKLGFLFKEK